MADNSEKRYTLQRCINSTALIVMILMTVLADVIPIGLGTTADVTKRFQNLFTPAPVTFGIFIVIYICFTLFVLWQWNLVGRDNSEGKMSKSVGPWFAITCLLTASWIVAWHLGILWLSVLSAVLLLVSLILATNSIEKAEKSLGKKSAAAFPFDIYLGFAAASVIANISVWLSNSKWDGFGLSEQFWTVLVLLFGAGIGSAFVIFKDKYLSALAFLWAYIGILIRHISPNGLNSKYGYVIAALIISIVLMGSTMLLGPIVKYTKGRNGKPCTCKACNAPEVSDD